MATQWLIGFVLLSLPLLVGVGMVVFMMSGKGNSKTTDEILELRKERRLKEEIQAEDLEQKSR
ncbi:MAG: hypothetical protein KDC83_08325 [Flavobacteriales bacterium]|nr:hypothetical protein [Flavobacteriales bacterium]